MGKLWNILEEWRDGMAYPPSYRKIARDLHVSQSAFDTWKAPTEIPKTYNLLAISRLTGVPYRRVVDAVVEDTRLYDEQLAEKAWRRRMGDGPQVDIVGGAEVENLSATNIQAKPESEPARAPRPDH